MMMQMATSAVLSGFLFICRPSLFPSLTDGERKVAIDKNLFLKGMMPVSLFYVGQLVFSNTAYLHVTVAFLQMMKESNLVIVYMLSLMVGLERFRWRHVCVLVLVSIVTLATIKGEMHFSLLGFGLQGFSQLCESIKICLQGVLLSRRGTKLDALTYVLLITPVTFIALGYLLLMLYAFPVSFIATPDWPDIEKWWPQILGNCLTAFALNVIAALFMKYSSPVAFILAGIVKDASIVLVDRVILQEPVTCLQGVCFVLQLLLILFWMLMKAFPERFEQSIAKGVFGFLLGRLQNEEPPPGERILQTTGTYEKGTYEKGTYKKGTYEKASYEKAPLGAWCKEYQENKDYGTTEINNNQNYNTEDDSKC